MPPTITHILETCLSVRSMSESAEFYKKVLGLEPFLEAVSSLSTYPNPLPKGPRLIKLQPRITGFALGPTTLLLFQIGATAEDSVMEGRGVIPGHGPSQDIIDALQTRNPNGGSQSTLKQHFCLAVKSPEDVCEWERRFKEHEVQVLGTMNWERGGRSVYFADPDGNVGEIGSKGIWEHY